MANLLEYLKNPIPSLLSLFNLHRVTPGPVPPRPTSDPRDPYGARPPSREQQKDPFQRPSQTIADSIKRRAHLNRIEKYAIYEEMDRDPLNDEILNAYAEAITALNYDKGVVFWVVAENEDVQRILTDMYASVGAQEKAFAQVRAMLKHGDNFLGLKYTERSSGIVALRHYEPWKVARIQDELNRLSGFAPADGSGEPSKIDSDAVPPYDILHQRLLSKDQDTEYGTGLFDSSWEDWEDLQSMMDQIVLQRLLRRPDRLMILMDSTGMSLQEAFEAIKVWESYLYKEINVNTGQRILESRGIPMTENRDLIIPKGPNNGTTIENFPASANNDLYRDWDIVLSKYLGTNGVPKGYFGFEGGDYRSDMTLAKQDPRFAKRAQRGQFSFLQSMTRLGMIHLALVNMDPFRKTNRFEVHGMPISNFMEIEYNELLQMRWDLVDRMARVAEDLRLNPVTWIRYVLINVGKLPSDLVDSLMAQQQEESLESPQAAEMAAALKENKELVENLNEVERSLQACRHFSGPQLGLTEDRVKEFVQVGKDKEIPDNLFDAKSGGAATVRKMQEERAKARLDRLNAMACSIG